MSCFIFKLCVGFLVPDDLSNDLGCAQVSRGSWSVFIILKQVVFDLEGYVCSTEWNRAKACAQTPAHDHLPRLSILPGATLGYANKMATNTRPGMVFTVYLLMQTWEKRIWVHTPFLGKSCYLCSINFWFFFFLTEAFFLIVLVLKRKHFKYLYLIQLYYPSTFDLISKVFSV